MIASAEMGNAAGDTAYLKSELVKQISFAVLSFGIYLFLSSFPVSKLRLQFYYAGYIVILVLLLSTRLFSAVGGAYGWIRLGPVSIQPSEFAKTFIILFGAKLLGINNPETNKKNFITYAVAAAVYVLIILVYQSDLGSAAVLAIIAYCICLVPVNKEIVKIQRVMFLLMLGVIALAVFMMTPLATKFLMHFSDDYKVGRFLAAADPFMFQYDIGYHLIMSLVSFAQGGVLGLGYGNSIHKYMNFPNPSSDFILAVIVEELGFVGFIVVVLLYLLILIPIMYYSTKTTYISSKIILMGTFLYFVVHFILNVGGVSGFIPLTGVPLLIMSAGGSSLLSSLAALGICQAEIERIKGKCA